MQKKKSRIKNLIDEFKANFDVEIQQRAVEYSRIFPNEKVRRALLEKIPIEEKPKGEANEKGDLTISFFLGFFFLSFCLILLLHINLFYKFV